MMNSDVEIVSVNATNVAQYGFFCRKSKPKSEGYRRSDQCPYINDAVKRMLETAGEIGIQTQVVELGNCQEAQDLAPSAYGIFNVVYNGKLLTADFHPIGKKELLKRLDKHPS